MRSVIKKARRRFFREKNKKAENGKEQKYTNRIKHFKYTKENAKLKVQNVNYSNINFRIRKDVNSKQI